MCTAGYQNYSIAHIVSWVVSKSDISKLCAQFMRNAAVIPKTLEERMTYFLFLNIKNSFKADSTSTGLLYLAPLGLLLTTVSI